MPLSNSEERMLVVLDIITKAVVNRTGKCRDCLYWDRDPKNISDTPTEFGVCRRRANGWHSTGINDWCGEFYPRKEMPK